MCGTWTTGTTEALDHAGANNQIGATWTTATVKNCDNAF